MQTLSDFVTSPYEILTAAEAHFLKECGWSRSEDAQHPDTWIEPVSAVGEVRKARYLAQAHAVNSELLHGPRRTTFNANAHQVLINAQEVYLMGRGWERVTPKGRSVQWKSPRKPRHLYALKMAVNKQKWFDRQAGAADLPAASENAADGAVDNSTPTQ